MRGNKFKTRLHKCILYIGMVITVLNVLKTWATNVQFHTFCSECFLSIVTWLQFRKKRKKNHKFRPRTPFRVNRISRAASPLRPFFQDPHHAQGKDHNIIIQVDYNKNDNDYRSVTSIASIDQRVYFDHTPNFTLLLAPATGGRGIRN